MAWLVHPRGAAGGPAGRRTARLGWRGSHQHPQPAAAADHRLEPVHLSGAGHWRHPRKTGPWSHRGCRRQVRKEHPARSLPGSGTDRHWRLAAPPRHSPGHRAGLEAHRPLTRGQRGQRLPQQLVPRRSAPLRSASTHIAARRRHDVRLGRPDQPLSARPGAGIPCRLGKHLPEPAAGRDPHAPVLGTGQPGQRHRPARRQRPGRHPLSAESRRERGPVDPPADADRAADRGHPPPAAGTLGP